MPAVLRRARETSQADTASPLARTRPELVRRRVAIDIEYIERQSLMLDLIIMAQTIPCLLGDDQGVR
jgi:lipopolysaccharide/colanic/teichoic acid biosynthesis glycosyltransferase